MMRRPAMIDLVMMVWLSAASSAGAQPMAVSTGCDRPMPSVGDVIAGTAASVRHLPFHKPMTKIPHMSRASRFAKPFRVADGRSFKLKTIDPRDTSGMQSQQEAAEWLERGVSKHIWQERFTDINAFERYATRNGIAIRKFVGAGR
jgi:hypothetical protein